MKFTITTRDAGDVTIMDLKGKLVIGEESASLRLQIRDLLLHDRKKLLLNFSQVSYIDRSGLGDLLSAFSIAQKHGGELKLLHLANQFRDLMQVTKLHLFFEIMDGEELAVKSFAHSDQMTK